MNLIELLRQRFAVSLATVDSDTAPLLAMIRPSQDAKFGDYQANFAMPLKAKLGKAPQQIAADVIAATKLDDLCEPATVAGPGFINLKFRDSWLEERLNLAVSDPQLGIAPAAQPRTYIVDFSSPNVAKPMHVGHIRSTVIGDSLCKILRALGHHVVSDNHLGDWGTQFGMIIYGIKHFADTQAYKSSPVKELGRLYKLVHKLVDYRESLAAIPTTQEKLTTREAELATASNQPPSADKAVAKKAAQTLAKLQLQVKEQREALAALQSKIAAMDADPLLSKLVQAHPTIDADVLAETAKLHAGDSENRQIWHEVLPFCREEIQRIYKRLSVTFDEELGESFYHDRLEKVVDDLAAKGLARESQGATAVFLEGFDAPMLVRKRDGAFLYATTDLATIQYRQERWKPDAIWYVVDHRQSEHFDKLFIAAKAWGYTNTDLTHVKFGTVLGDDGKPFKTRSGDTVGLDGLLDEAISRALAIVQSSSSDLSPDEQQQVAERVGIGALKYADLSQNRTSDYTFSYDKMLQMNGNTATYMQYSYARVRSIFSRGNIDIAALRTSGALIALTEPAERALGLSLLRFEEALAEAVATAMPHHLTTYLFDLAKSYSTFFENCKVLKADDEATKNSRLLLCDLTARTIKHGLSLLGIDVVERM